MDGQICLFFFFQAEDGIRDHCVTGVQTCALPIWLRAAQARRPRWRARRPRRPRARLACRGDGQRGAPRGSPGEAMSTPEWTLVGLGSVLVLYLALVVFLYLVGRREDARAAAGFIPDCLVLFRRLIADPRVPRWRKALLAVLLAYLAMPV